MKVLTFFTLVLTVLLPNLVSAHTRWFAESELQTYVSNEPTDVYLTVWALIIAGIVMIGLLMHQRRIFHFGWMRASAPHSFERAASTFTMVAGSFFLIAGTHEYLFSPNLTIESGIPYVLVVVQILIGLFFMLGILTRVSAVVLALLWVSTFYYAGWVAALEDVWVLSTAAFIAIMGNDYFSIISYSALKKYLYPYRTYALSILRIGTGLTLMILGLSEKILAPEYGMNFLSQHNWNFMQLLGFNYSDYLFVISAGSVEFLFGLIFVLGIVTRLNALVAAVFFTVPLFILGPIELAGHVPHFGAVFLLLLFGNGGHFIMGKHYHDEEVCQNMGICPPEEKAEI